MHHVHSLFVLICLHLLFIVDVAGTAIPYPTDLLELPRSLHETTCPDGLSGRVTQIQQQTLSRPSIYITDCSPSRNDTINSANLFINSTLVKRQECAADCSVSCSGGGGGPSSSDCNTLASQIASRNQALVVGGFLTVTQAWQTCQFSLVNMVSSTYNYCDSSWAGRSQGVISQCLPASSGGMCQGSRFQAVVGVNPSQSTPTTVQASPTTTNNAGTTNQGNGSGNSSNNNNNNNNNNNGGGGNNGATTSNGANTNAGGGNASNSNGGAGSTSGVSNAGGASTSQSGGVGSSTTTLSNGSVMVVPSGGVSLPGNSNNTDPGGQQPGNGGSSINVAAIVGTVLGLLVLLALLILLFLWRRKRRAQRNVVALEGSKEMAPRESSVARTINSATAPDAPVLGLGQAERDTQMRETGTGGTNLAWATNSKSRMLAEEAQPRRSQTELSSVGYTSLTEPMDRSRSSGSRRERHGEGDRQRRGHRVERSRDQQAHHAAYASDSYSTLTGGSDPPSNSNSMSARTFAQAAAPNLSPSDIDRLAESIVARMQGRNTVARAYGTDEGRSTVDEEDEPPPPWSPNRASVT